MLHVFVDESARDERGLCIVANVTLDTDALDSARSDLVALLPRGAKRLHWNKDGAAVRTAVIQALARHAHHLSAYISYYDSSKRVDNARERCLIHLFADVGGAPYTRVILDQRTAHQDTRDRVLFAAQCVRLRLPNPPELHHDGTFTEPLLWFADALAGAVGEHLVNNDVQYMHVLASKLTIV